MIFRRDAKHRIVRKLLENVPHNHFLPYPYQLDLLDTACERNTIMCLSNEVTKNFIIISLIRELQYDNKDKQVIYFTQDKCIQESANCIARHTGLKVTNFSYRKPYTEWNMSQWTSELSRHEVVVISPWLFYSWIIAAPNDAVYNFFSEHVFLLFVSECHHVLDSRHPYYHLFGPRGLKHFDSDTCPPGSVQKSHSLETNSLLPNQSFRIVCFTSALLPREILDPVQAKTRLITLEHRTHCRLETASELLTMLSLGARPKERVLCVSNTSHVDHDEGVSSVHQFVTRVLAETSEFLNDVGPTSDNLSITTNTQSPPIATTQVPDSRGRLICALDYCRRAVAQCETILHELGVWCAAQIARVFVKHLIGLDRRRTAQLAKVSASSKLNKEGSESTDKLPEHGEDQLARILRFTYTQLCLIVRLFQVEFDTCLTLDTLRTMISPKILTMIDQLKTYKPSLDFRIEVAELPSPFKPGVGRKACRRRRRNRSQISDSTSPNHGVVAPLRLLSASGSSLSDSSADTMSSLSDADEQSDKRSVSSRVSSTSRNSSIRSGAKRSRSKGSIKHTGAPNPRTLHFVPASTLNEGGLRPGLDPSQLVYRAVLAPNSDGDRPHHTRLCGLVLVRCQFTAYALSRLIDELCVWDVDMFFIKPGHLFSHRGLPTNRSRPSGSTNPTLLKTGDEAVTAQPDTHTEPTSFPATQEETIAKFRRGSINLLIATQPAVSAAASGAELPRCNLVVALQPPHSLAEYLSSKARSRLVDHGAQVIYLVDDDAHRHREQNSPRTTTTGSMDNDKENVAPSQNNVLDRFQKLERLLIERCRGFDLFADEHDVNPDVADSILPSFRPRGPNGPKLVASKAINVINQFCARLPSDYITNLTPRWRLRFVPLPPNWDPPVQGPGASCGLDWEVSAARTHGLYQCLLRLPINTSVKDEIEGEPMACKKLAKLSAAFNAVRALYAVGELDSRWEPSTRDPVTVTASNRLAIDCAPAGALRRTNSMASSFMTESEAESELSDLMVTCNPDVTQDPHSGLDGSSRRRRYYYRKFPDQLSNCFPRCGSPSPNFLYYIDMKLTNALPDYQNSRGRPCHRPEDEPLGFGLLTTKPLHHIPTFPIFSRSGEETVRFVEFWSPLASAEIEEDDVESCLPVRAPPLTEDQLNQLVKFHRIIFQEVLRLERDAVIEFNFDRAYTQLLVVPVRRGDKRGIDWDFVRLVLDSYTPEGFCRLLPRRDLSRTSELPQAQSVSSSAKSAKSGASRTGKAGRGSGTRAGLKARHLSNPLLNQPGVFDFRESDFMNAVVMPGYRNLDQPQHYYVAEIRYDLNPLSPFPSSSYANFASYYTSKYEATISTSKQPLLDVDFTVMRLNLIVPRYVNIRGHYLPCSTDTHKRDRRENLVHKQILIPELCFRHPFPASVWRKAVCLPSVLYRLHCLLLAEELRRRIALETGLGLARLPTYAQPLSSCGNRGDVLPLTDAAELFEPLRVIFPLEVQRAVGQDEQDERGKMNNNKQSGPKSGRHRKGRKGRDTGVASKEVKKVSDDVTSSNQSTDQSKTDQGDGKSVMMEPADGSDDDEDDGEHGKADGVDGRKHAVDDEQGSGDDPQIVNLCATSSALPTCATGVLTAPVASGGAGNLEAMLEETKVIELDEEAENDGSLSALNPDTDQLIMIDSDRDRVYLETGSDVESVDSFEGNVRFFPSEDDCEVEHDEDDGRTTTTQLLSSPQFRFNRRAYRPGPTNVLQALTMSCSNDFINLERMETIGDSFLKFVVTVHLYLSHPTAHEGKLSHLRSRIVCNTNLYRLGRAKNLPDRMIAGKFGPGENWVPPGYIVRHDRRVQPRPATPQRTNDGDLTIWSTDTLMDDEVLLGIKVSEEHERVKPIDNFAISEWDPKAPEVMKTLEGVDRCLITIQQAIPDKSVADCVEALIGCYLTARGERSALRLMRWFGIDCLPSLDTQLSPKGAPWIPPQPSISPSDPKWAQLAEARLAWRFNELEATLQYTFKDPSLLIQAFTHPSYHQLRTTSDPTKPAFLTDTDCYQRLEFLGDAVLDYVITRFLYEDSEQHSPGVLTDLRSALVNNNIFAALAVRVGLHMYLRASSPQLLHTVDAFVRYQKEVAKDDLDFITNEDIEIRQPDPTDAFGDEVATDALVNPDMDSARISPTGDNWEKTGLAEAEEEETNKDKLSKLNGSTVKEDEEDVEEDHATVDAMALGDVNDCERKWAQAQAQQLTGNFVEDVDSVAQEDHHSTKSTINTTKVSSTVFAAPTSTVHRVSDDVEIPKALGDIFESLAGAIFLDSGMSLDTVWTVFYPLMKERIERYTACIPKSPVRQLLELEPEGTRFERPRRTADGRISVCAHVLGKGRFYGIGRNYRLAKSLAAKRALRVLRKLQETTAPSQSSANNH